MTFQIGDLVLEQWGVDNTYYTVDEFEGWDGPETRGEDVPRARDDGDYTEDRYLTGRRVTLRGHVLSDDLEAALDRLTAATDLLRTDGRFRFRDRVAFVRREGRLLLRRRPPDTAEYELTLAAADPRKYSLDETVVGLAAAQPGAGLTWPLVWPLVWGWGFSGVTQITNDGNFPALPVWTVYGPVTSPRLEHVTSDRTVTLAGLTLTASEFVVVDFAARTVLLMGTASRYHLFTGDWWALAPGVNDVRYDSADGARSSTLSYRHAWI